MAERLPSLYPMPRDCEQYAALVESARDRPTRAVFHQRLQERLRRIGGEEAYSEAMVEKIESNVLNKGFLAQEDDHVYCPLYALAWDGSETSFHEYVRGTIRTWSNEFHDGFVLVTDLLGILDRKPKAEVDLIQGLIGTEEKPGKYDPHDRWASRTIREVLKLLCAAKWAGYAPEGYTRTPDGTKARQALRKRDPLLEAERLLLESDPVASTFLTNVQKIDLAKHYIFRQCGGKYHRDPVRRAQKALFDPKTGKVRTKIRDEQKRLTQERQGLKAEIQARDRELGRECNRLRSLGRLRAISESLAHGDYASVSRLLAEEGTTFAWSSIRHLAHKGKSYTFREDIQPYGWQKAALEKWREQGRRGVLAVVTGAGKTVFALRATADAHQEDQELRLTVLVPTKVLMYQWARELVRILAIPTQDIGLRGDGHKDSFGAGKRVMVCIVNSAVQDDYLVKDVAAIDPAQSHLLVADECHRYRGEEFRKAFECRKTWALGLSATPAASEDQGTGGEEPDIVTENCGPIFFKYSYREALSEGIIQPFEIRYMGVELTPTERVAYDQYTKKLSKALDKIRQRYGPRLEAMRAHSLDQKLQSILKSDEHPDPAIQDYFRFVRERKDVVFGCLNRKRCYLDLITRHTIEREKRNEKQDKVIVFHERIEQLEEIVAPEDRRRVLPPEMLQEDPLEKEVNAQLVGLFLHRQFRPVMYHSGHARPVWNQIGMEWFRADIANVMLSVRALIEGVDVPAANVGIIRASSSSVRQRIQTTGRVLRKHRTKDTPSILYVIYARDTTDERIFRGLDWNEELGSSAVKSYHWYPKNTNILGSWDDQEGQLPEVPGPEEDEAPLEVDSSILVNGQAYPGRYAGVEYHVDAQGRPFKRVREGRRILENPEIRLAALEILRLKGGGKFVVTPQGHIVTKVRGQGLLYLGTCVAPVQEAKEVPGTGVRRLGDKPPSFDELFG